jgi:secreted protein with Ig-like and vWFA domain
MFRNSWGPMIVTLISFGLVGWALYHVFGNLDTVPKTNRNGTIIANPLQNAKDVLTVVVPFASAAVGFWFGSDGKSKAQDQAQQAHTQAQQAQTQAEVQRGRADREQKQKTAVLQAASEDTQNLLDKARHIAPEAFS